MKIIHLPQSPWLLSDRPDLFTVRLWAEPGLVSSCRLLYSDPYDYLQGRDKQLNWSEAGMELLARNDDYEVWSCRVSVPTQKLSYLFEVLDKDGNRLWLGQDGLSGRQENTGIFRTGYHFGEDRLPSWTGKSVWYQVFPDRFSGGSSDGVFTPSATNFWGGTLEGIRQHIPYLQGIGVTGLYLNPVFSSPSNHRYDTLDYTQVDSRLGTNESLVRLAEELHRNHIKLMLDGVFNHASDQCRFFRDVKERGEYSPYRDWFIIHDLDSTMNEPTGALTPERMRTDPPYECFAFAANMPKWNTGHPEVQEYLIGAAENWTRQLNLDAWRLDVPDEVSPEFLRLFRRRMRTVNPEILILGEIWTDPSAWTQTGLFDGTMDYPLYHAVSRFLLQNCTDAYTFCNAMNRRQGIMTNEMLRNQMIFLGNHDLPRCLTLADHDLEKVKAAWLLLCLLDGELNLYYGDEQALTGGQDPANRGVMRWEESENDSDMMSFVTKTVSLRKQLQSSFISEMRFEAFSADTALLEMTRGDKRYIFCMYASDHDNEDLRIAGKPLLKGKHFKLWEVAGNSSPVLPE